MSVTAVQVGDVIGTYNAFPQIRHLYLIAASVFRHSVFVPYASHMVHGSARRHMSHDRRRIRIPESSFVADGVSVSSVTNLAELLAVESALDVRR